MRILGIDPGSRFCGFGVVEDLGAGQLRHVAHGVIVLDAEAPLEARLEVLFEKLNEELARHRPAIVAIEEIFHARNARSALVLGHARGVALLAAMLARAEVRSFAATVVKQAVTGSGRAEKSQVARMVEALLGIRVAMRADATDALAIALCGALRGGRGRAASSASTVASARRTPAAENLARLLAQARTTSSKTSRAGLRSLAKRRQK